MEEDCVDYTAFRNNVFLNSLTINAILNAFYSNDILSVCTYTILAQGPGTGRG